MNAFAGTHFASSERAVLIDLEKQLAGPEIDRLVLDVVVLQAQGVALIDMNDLADVPVGFCPVQLVTPRFVDASNGIRHDVPFRNISCATRAVASSIAA